MFFSAISAADFERWEIVGLSGTANPIETLNDAANGIFVPVFAVWRHLNFNRSERGDTLIVRSGQNELRLLKNSDKYLFNGKAASLNHSTIVKNNTTYSDIESFVMVMNKVSGLFFIPDMTTRQIRVSRTSPTPPAQTVASPAATTPAPVARGASNVSGIVVIDPGHGGRDPGAIGPNGVMEKDVVLAIAQEVKKFLAKHEGIQVFMTRDEDVFVPLRSRTEFANNKNADLFISIHTNASTNANLGGYKMYFLSEANNEMDEMSARMENSVLGFEGIDMTELSDIEAVLLSLANSEFIRESQEFSIMIERSFARNIRELRRLHTGVGQANFLVLAGAAMPAVLVETGFISNTREEKLLSDPKFQRRAGEGLGEAIIEFLRKYPSMAVGR